ncbi:pyruvate, water dikinase regulatory protein [Abyssisolibacter fermentans]|uniref:pyruvate, water dikinase regulatory protein n=1 Tax=Abyssisolibacter fermentans TaxID=1766203 RepID=UPI000836095D|nr:pyruvate, water dikinase regulatory protein [Abyssisolibacter fermentans]
MEKGVVVYVLSDSIGETGEQVAKAALSQFNSSKHEIRRFPYITDNEHIKEIVDEAKYEKCIIVFTIVVVELRNYLIKKCKENNIKCFDLMTPLLDHLQDTIAQPPKREPGLIRRLDEKYFRKVEAVEFAVKYDDGKDARGIKKADIVLIGVSRTSKTPLSMYLAHKNIKVANVPLIPEVLPPEGIFEIDHKKIIGLTANPEKLNQIRQERLKTLGLSNNANYAAMERILEELTYAEKIMKKLSCTIIDVSNKAVEETAGIILDMIKYS